MKPISKIEQEVNQIRLGIYEKTKDMTIQERLARVNKIGEAAAQKYGFRRVVNAKDITITTPSEVVEHGNNE